MRTLNAAAISAIAQQSVALAMLVKLDLTAPVYLNTSGWGLTWNSNLYTGTGLLGSIREIEDAPGEVKGIGMSLAGIDASAIALALTEPVQGKTVTIYTAIFDPATYQIADATVEWAGKLDVFNIIEDGETCTLELTAEHSGIDLLRPNTVRYSNSDQRRLFPSDRGFEYVVDQSDQAIVWPSREFFKK